MNELSITKHNGGAYLNSSEVAGIIGMQHKHLLRDIRGYCLTIAHSAKNIFRLNDFFLESTYTDGTGRELRCYLISKMGCELVATKLTGEKGVLFTAAYVSRFNQLETAERESQAAVSAPRLGEYNACARIIMRGLKQLGAPPGQVMQFLKDTYAPLGISVDIDTDKNNKTATRWYRASEIAEKAGMYSLYGKPHAQAMACVLNEKVYFGSEHKRVETDNGNGYDDIRVLYDNTALSAVMKWLDDCGWPGEIYSYGRTYHVQY